MLARKDQTWQFWIQCVFQDLMAYVSLFFSMCGGDWCLRVASIKKMAATFAAFDHTHYVKLISQHLDDLLSIPQSVLTVFEQGAFVISIRGREWHSVGMDESHEMLVNKSCKTAIVRPSKDHIDRLIHYLPYRTVMFENLSEQLFPEKQQVKKSTLSLITGNPSDYKREKNIPAQIATIEKHKLLEISTANRGLINPFSDKTASTQQCYDPLNFRIIGQKDFDSRINFFILKEPSCSAPTRKGNLQTFSTKKSNKQRVSQLEKDRKLILSCMRKKMKWSSRTGVPIETLGEQLITFPLAISDHNGNPIKAIPPKA